MRQLSAVFSVLLLLSPSGVWAQCPDGERVVAILLPLSGEQEFFGQSFLNGVFEGDQMPLEEGCGLRLQYFDTQDETTSFVTQWHQMLEQQPDLLIGPLLKEHQEQLEGMKEIELHSDSVWLYPGDLEKLDIEPLSLPSEVELFAFSLGHRSLVRNMLEFAWDQGQHDLALLLPDSDQGRSIAEMVLLEWEGRGGAVVAVVHYGERFSALNRGMRQLIQQSKGRFDFVLTLADDQRMRMIPPLMSYHSREEPVYSLTPPVRTKGLKKDLEGILYPMQPALLDRQYQEFEVDDFLLQIENIGFDLMLMLRGGHWQDLQQKGSYLGRAGRYTVEGQMLVREPCFVEHKKGRMVLLQCPEDGSAAKIDKMLRH